MGCNGKTNARFAALKLGSYLSLEGYAEYGKSNSQGRYRRICWAGGVEPEQVNMVPCPLVRYDLGGG